MLFSIWDILVERVLVLWEAFELHATDLVKRHLGSHVLDGMKAQEFGLDRRSLVSDSTKQFAKPSLPYANR